MKVTLKFSSWKGPLLYFLVRVVRNSCNHIVCQYLPNYWFPFQTFQKKTIQNAFTSFCSKFLWKGRITQTFLYPCCLVWYFFANSSWRIRLVNFGYQCYCSYTFTSLEIYFSTTCPLGPNACSKIFWRSSYEFGQSSSYRFTILEITYQTYPFFSLPCYLVGDGSLIDIFHDIWFPEIGPLCQYPLNISAIEEPPQFVTLQFLVDLQFCGI